LARFVNGIDGQVDRNGNDGDGFLFAHGLRNRNHWTRGVLMTPEQLQAEVAAFIAAAKERAKDGISVADVGALVVSLLRLSVAGLDSIPLEGAAKKEWALEAVGLLFDSVAGFAVPAYLYPVWVLIRPAVRQLVIAAAGGALESLLPIVRKAAA
jgi:hypothetical protein